MFIQHKSGIFHPVSTHRQCYPKVFVSNTVPEYQNCLITYLRAWNLDKYSKVTISFFSNVVHSLPTRSNLIT